MLATFSEAFNKHVGSKKALVALVTLYILSKAHKRINAHSLLTKLQKIAEKKRKQRDAQIVSEFLDPNEINEETKSLILTSNVSQLSQLLNEDKITSEQILKVYHSRAVTLGFSLELITESNYKEALELARRCDETRKNTQPEDRHKLGKLFGIPISVKDSFVQKGLDATSGSTGGCFNPCPEDGEIVAVLKSRGAIPYIKSNVPQTLAVLDCVNNVWGRGLNPWNKNRSVGGSSGGEAGLIAARCSPIGLASDGLGSIRIPAAFCGVCGFKPTKGRVVTKGHCMLGVYSSKLSAIFPNYGPMARCVDDMVAFTSVLITEETRISDPMAPYIPWDEEKYQSKNKLRIAYTVTEDFFGAAQPCQRAVREAVQALEKLGHEVVEIKIPHFEKIILLMLMMTGSEGYGKGLISNLAGEKPINELKGQLHLKQVPTFVKKLIRNLLELKGFDRLAKIVQSSEERSIAEYHEKMYDFFTLRGELLSFFAKEKFDALVTPAMALPAFKHGYGVDLAIASCYNWIANATNMPAGVIPVTKVREGEDKYLPGDSIHIDKMFKDAQKSMEGSVGLPVCVQVMSLPWEDEKCFAVMKAIESEVKFNEFPNV